MAERVLIVDGYRSSLGTLAALFEGAGYLPTVADSGEAALDLARRHRFDAVLLDLDLPGMDGWEMMKNLRNQWRMSGWPQIPFVILSARSCKEEIIRAYASGVSYYGCKPARSQEILSGVAMALRFDSPRIRRPLAFPRESQAPVRRSA